MANALKMFDLENECQDHGIQYTLWRNSMAKIKIYKCHHEFLPQLNVSEILTFQILGVTNLGQGQVAKHS